MILEAELNLIQDFEVKVGVAALILANQEWIKTAPPSVSGKHHPEEKTMEMHLRRTVWFAKQYIEEFKLDTATTDLLIASCLLHDIGRVNSLVKGDAMKGGWKFYPVTGWSCNFTDQEKHPLFSKDTVTAAEFKRSAEIGEVVSKHMSHWNAGCPAPVTEIEKMVAMCDFLASRNIQIPEVK